MNSMRGVMIDEFHKVDDVMTLWSDYKKYYYENDCFPNVRLVCSGNFLKDDDHNKIYEIVNDEFIYLRKKNFRYIEGGSYV